MGVNPFLMTTDSTIDAPEPHLEGLGDEFMKAVQRMEKNDIDAAAEILRRILQKEPRLAEPRIELARILVETRQIFEAESEIREAIRILENGGQWLDELSETQVQSVAYGLLAEVLRLMAEEDDIVFGDPEKWRAIVDESHAAFRKARSLDPDNAHAEYWATSFDFDAKNDEATD